MTPHLDTYQKIPRESWSSRGRTSCGWRPISVVWGFWWQLEAATQATSLVTKQKRHINQRKNQRYVTYLRRLWPWWRPEKHRENNIVCKSTSNRSGIQFSAPTLASGWNLVLWRWHSNTPSSHPFFCDATDRIPEGGVIRLPVKQAGLVIPNPNLSVLENWMESCVVKLHLVAAL